ncbi:MAG: hypothetical protein WC812_00510 [Candidatus Pacearchaeota archaeon]|jgi:hypothetical protein
MVTIRTNKIKFSPKRSFFIWDWEDSKKPYVRDFGANIYFFIKDENPKKVLEDIFIDQIKSFEFKADIEGGVVFEGDTVHENFKYLFAKFSGSRFPEFDWTFYEYPNKRDTSISRIKKEEDFYKYFSKFID